MCIAPDQQRSDMFPEIADDGEFTPVHRAVPETDEAIVGLQP